MRDSYPGMRASRQRRPWLSLWGSRSRISGRRDHFHAAPFRRDGALSLLRRRVLSGIVEPIGAIATILLTAMVVPMMPYLLSFAAGAMMYVVVEELIPEMSAGEHSDVGVISFAIGFMLMMALDVALG